MQTDQQILREEKQWPISTPREYFPTLQEWIRYGGDITWDDYSIMKNHGDHVQLMFPSSAAKGHDTYDLYHDDNGRMTKVFGHPGNAGFEGWKYD